MTSRAPAYRCSARSADLDEPILGTASVVRTWLLIEHPSSWARVALASRRLPPSLGADLARRANRARVRVVLIRRPGRTPPGKPTACFVAVKPTSGVGRLSRADLDSPAEALDLDLDAISHGVPAGFDRVDGLKEPLICVCAHGSHDPCCAERGRPVAAVLAARFPDLVWEVSHIGGDRFAGNAVMLPDGDYFGRLDSTSAVPVVEAYLDGRYVLTHLRGRAGLIPPIQAAEVLVRQRLGVDRRGAVRVVGMQRSETGTTATVRLAVDEHGELLATIAIGTAEPVRTLTCHAAIGATPPTYALVSLAAAAG